jgi:hypothetical protein
MDLEQCPAIAPIFGFLGVAASTIFASTYFDRLLLSEWFASFVLVPSLLACLAVEFSIEALLLGRELLMSLCLITQQIALHLAKSGR